MVNKEDIKTLKQPIMDTFKKFDFYKKYANYLESENERLNAIIDQTIEYIEEHSDNTNFIEVPSVELLNILGGTDE